jgi:hypothetical protein
MLSRELTAFGPFFAVETHGADESACQPWLSMSDLLADAGRLQSRVHATGTALAQGAQKPLTELDLRVVASVVHLGLVARLIAVAVGTMTLGRAGVSFSPNDLWWQDRLGGPYPLSVTPTATAIVPPNEVVEMITAAIGDRYRLSSHVLWGNVASAANSAARLISSTYPELSATAHDAADLFLADGRVEGGVLRSGPTFRRRSCCLIYRLADGGAVCGDCVLASGAPGLS